MNDPIKVGFCVAYDWYLLEFALPLIYEEATLICLSIDQDRVSWSRESYPFDQLAFEQLVRRIDTKRKITVYEDDFHLPALSPAENEVRQRTQLAAFMGPGGWHLQLDCDEYFMNFRGFIRYLRNVRSATSRPVNICCSLVTLYKKCDEGFLYIDPCSKENIEFIQIASKSPLYEHGRRNGYFNVFVNFKIIHQSWARSEEEIRQKLKSWGHNRDFDLETYYAQWKSLAIGNYRERKNFHPLQPELWPRLAFGYGKSILEFVKNFNEQKFVSFSRVELLLKNSRIVAKLKTLF